MKEYYDLRAPYYDDWWIGAARDRARLAGGARRRARDASRRCRRHAPSTSPAAPGYLTQHLGGEVVGLDQSASMLDEARRRLPDGEFVQGDALALPFPDGAFERIFTSYFYCHLVDEERVRFLAEARRVARELVVLGSRHGEGRRSAERWEERPLKDGSTWPVFKRVFDPEALAAELGGRRAARGPLVRRRAHRVTRYRSLASLKRDQRTLSRVRRGRLPARVAAGRSRRARASARTCSARRPASSRATSGGRGAAARARRCAAGSSSTRTSSTRRSIARR